MRSFFRKRALKTRGEGEQGELNVVPYLDILMNLIIFVLLSMTGLAGFGALNVSAEGRRGPSDEPAGPALRLTVAISRGGFLLSTGAGSQPRVPIQADGSFDYAGLKDRAWQVKAEHPGETKVVVAAEADIEYETLVATMDALRETADHAPLFPDVTLASSP